MPRQRTKTKVLPIVFALMALFLSACSQTQSDNSQKHAPTKKGEIILASLHSTPFPVQSKTSA